MLIDLIKYSGYWQVFDTDLYIKYLKAKLNKEQTETKSWATNDNLQTKK